ncbi:MAG: MraY family glycosyltransferase [Candidatus Magasanikbacteria bacterium]|nr:MraY family glycosyltransferase [Candidatus Magasanikbacteria bacterium]
MPLFLFSATICLVLTLLVRVVALKLKVIDTPDNDRKRHAEAVPLWGGLAIFLAFWIVVYWLVSFTNINHKHLSDASLIGIFLGSLILVIVGMADDKYKLSPLIRLSATVVAAFCVIAGGSELTSITNPFGGYIPLDMWRVGDLLVLANIVIFFWIFGMTYTVKILDGLDGLVNGVVLIGALMIHFLTASGKFYQADITAVSLILAGVCAGSLILNFHPAKIFLGEAGGLFLGFMLGALAIVAGGKIATALLVMAVPILDLVRVIYLRLKTGQPIFTGDRRHLHFKLLDLGLSHRQTVLIYYFIAFAFGMTTLFLHSWGKLVALCILTVAMIIFGVWLARAKEKYV